MEALPYHKRAITFIAIVDLKPFSGHPFKLYEGERLDDMVASIRANGVLVPIIVRRLEAILEILAGHNRVNAAKTVGLDEVPAIVLENISDEDAMVYVIETNLIQRSFADMTHSEKAAVIALHHSKMFSQGKRNDILEKIKMLENPYECKENETRSQIANSKKTITRVGLEYGLSKDTVARYLRVNQLISSLKAMLDAGQIGFIPAVSVSYVNETEQSLLVECMEQNDFSVDMKKADLLRQQSEKRKLDRESIFQILSGAIKPKPSRTPTVKVSKAVYTRYFKPNQSAKEVQATVEKALELYFSQL
jgi:ParB family chromosome partitioning protein